MVIGPQQALALAALFAVWGYNGGSYGPWYGGYYGPGAGSYGYFGGSDMMPAPAQMWSYNGGYGSSARGNTPYAGSYGYHSDGAGMMSAPAQMWGYGRTTMRSHGRHGW